MSVRNWGRETDSVLTSYRQPGSVDGKNGRDLEYEILPEGVFEIGLFGMEMMRATSGFTFEGPTPHISTTPQTPRATLIPVCRTVWASLRWLCEVRAAALISRASCRDSLGNVALGIVPRCLQIIVNSPSLVSNNYKNGIVLELSLSLDLWDRIIVRMGSIDSRPPIIWDSVKLIQILALVRTSLFRLYVKLIPIFALL